jgi:hypothetical protein
MRIIFIISVFLLTSCAWSDTAQFWNQKQQDIVLKYSNSWSDVTISHERKSSSPRIISRSSWWDNPRIMNGTWYFFPNIKFTLPSGGDFQCCWDTDSFSRHMIIFSGSTRIIEIKSYTNNIVVWGNYDHPISVTPSEYINSLSWTPYNIQWNTVYFSSWTDKYFFIADTGMLEISFSGSFKPKEKDEFFTSIQSD